MALFRRNYDKPGPGVPKNAPRKKGIARFFEILGRDFMNLVKLNMLYQLFLLPSQVFILLAVDAFFPAPFLFFLHFQLPNPTVWALVFLVLGLACGILVGPATLAMNHAISKMMRDDPGFIWHDFKKQFRENFKSMAVPGVLYTLLMFAEIFAFIYYYALSSAGGAANLVFTVIYFFSLLVFSMAAPYFFLQAGYLRLRTGGLLKNSLLLAFGFTPRSLVGGVVNSGLIAVQLIFFPTSSIFTLFIGYTIPTLFAQMWIWPPVDKTFKIEKTLRIREGLEEGVSEEEALAAEEEKERLAKEAEKAADGVEGWEDLEVPKKAAPKVGTGTDK